MTAHFGFVVALAVREFGITLAAAGELVVIELDAQAGLGGDADAAVGDGNAAAGHHFIDGCLPGIVCIAGVGEIGAGGGNVRHRHEAHAQVGVRVHGEAHAEHAAHVGKMLDLAHTAPIMGIAEHNLHCVEIAGAGDIGKIRNRNVAGERGVVAFGHQARRRTSAIPSSCGQGSSR